MLYNTDFFFLRFYNVESTLYVHYFRCLNSYPNTFKIWFHHKRKNEKKWFMIIVGLQNLK